MSASIFLPSAPEGPPPEPADRLDRLAALWRVLASPWLLFALCLALALLLAFALFLPQLPAELRDEAAARERWLAAVVEGLGAAGSLLRSLGLLDVLHNPVTLLVLAAVVFVLVLQLAEAIFTALRLHQLPAVLDAADHLNGEPLPVKTAGPLLRWRAAQSDVPLPVATQMHRLLEARFGRIELRTARVAPAPPAAAYAAQVGAGPLDVPTLEERFLALRGQRTMWLRPLLAAGMLLAAAAIWINAVFGWTYASAALIPGGQLEEAGHEVRLEYAMEPGGAAVLSPQLRITVGKDYAALPVRGALQTTVGGVAVDVTPGSPSLWVQTADGSALLARPGQSTPVRALGLGFPSAGSEETLLLPGQGAGLRLVRNDRGTPAAADDVFVAEVYRVGSDTPGAQFAVNGSQTEYVDTGSGVVAIQLAPLPSLFVQLHRSPAAWLVWPALLLALIGLLGFWRHPGFALVQIGPWPENRSVLTVQSDNATDMRIIQGWFEQGEDGADGRG